MGKGLLEQRLLALFAAGCLLLNFPLLALWDRDATVAGVPLFAAALFLVWGVLIAILAWLVERGEQGGAEDDSRASVTRGTGTGTPGASGFPAGD